MLLSANEDNKISLIKVSYLLQTEESIETYIIEKLLELGVMRYED